MANPNAPWNLKSGQRIARDDMINRILSALTIWALAVGCCFAFSEEPQQAPPPAPAAAPPASALAAPPREPTTRTTYTEPSAAEQIQALARHAGKGMLCYTAPKPNRGALAAAGKDLNVVSVGTLPTRRK